MMKIDTKIKDETKKAKREFDRANLRNIYKASGFALKVARRKIKKKKKGQASPPGTPPHTHDARVLKRAMVFEVEEKEQSSVLGPRFSRVGRSAVAQEYGGLYMGRRYPERSFMGPTLDDIIPPLPNFWADSVRT